MGKIERLNILAPYTIGDRILEQKINEIIDYINRLPVPPGAEAERSEDNV